MKISVHMITTKASAVVSRHDPFLEGAFLHIE